MTNSHETHESRDIRRQPFYWIDRAFLERYAEKVGPNGIAVYNALIYRANHATGQAWPGLADLSRLTGIRSKNTLRKTLRQLASDDVALIRITTRHTGERYLSNLYEVLPIPGDDPGQEMHQGRSSNAPGVGQEMHQGRSGDAPGVGQEMHQVGQEMHQGGAGNDTEQQSVNNNHQQESTNKRQQQQHALPAAAADILLENSLNPTSFNGTAVNLAAWILYASTQPRLENPVGYAITQVKKKTRPDPVFLEIAQTNLELDVMIRNARHVYAAQMGIQGYALPDEMFDLSDNAVGVLKRLHEARA